MTKIKAKSLTSEKNEALSQLSTNKIKLEEKYNEIELLNSQVAKQSSDRFERT